ncbi:hypothetical protein DFH11DRAFT_485499 [Phellopilus nigrolimitatus]|nr:hypothetical protein DFH11DRAFT_485499 [Phellopilus nigrolimitatus]
MLCLDAIVFLLLCLSLVTSRRLGGLTWLGRAMHVFGEGGGAQLLVAALALAFVVIWKGGNSLSTIPRVPIALFPAVYANTVLLNATRSYVGISLFASSSSHQQAGSSAATPSSYTPPAKYEHKEDIEMGLRGVSRSNEGVARRIDLTTAGTSSGTGSGSYGTTTADSTDAGAALRAHAMAVGAQREREEAARKARKAAEAGPTAQALMHMERDTLGESSAAREQGSNTGLSSTRPSAGQVAALTQRSGEAAPSVRSHMSGISQGALSLELPVFRKGRGYDINGLYMGDDDDTSSYISSDDGDGGTWDYGYAVNIANLERERERAATLLASSKLEADNAQAKVAPGLRWQVQNHMKRSSYPVLSRSRPTSKRRSAFSPQDSSAALGDGEDDEDDDKLSVLSTASRRTRSRHSHSHLPMPVRRLLPRVPTIPDDASVADSGEGSIMVIGRRPEPSIAEASVFRAASVAATRASTGSAFSSFTYPKPMAFPDLDEDLSLSGSADPTAASARFYYDPDSAGSSALGAVVDQNLGDRVSSVTGGGTGDTAPHPYAAAADEADERRQREEESAKRRWRVHPLKRMVEVGRLRR